MMHGKNRVFPMILTVVAIVIIIYLFATVKQPLVVCERKITDNLDITIKEELEVTMDGSKIGKIVLVKTIKLPDEYLNDETYINSIMFMLESSYSYLDKDKVEVDKTSNSVISRVEIDNKEVVMLNNIEFMNDDGLQMKINSNTKSSDVVTLKIKDSYTEGELMARMRNNGYSCR